MRESDWKSESERILQEFKTGDRAALLEQLRVCLGKLQNQSHFLHTIKCSAQILTLDEYLRLIKALLEDEDCAGKTLDELIKDKPPAGRELHIPLILGLHLRCGNIYQSLSSQSFKANNTNETKENPALVNFFKKTFKADCIHDPTQVPIQEYQWLEFMDAFTVSIGEREDAPVKIVLKAEGQEEYKRLGLFIIQSWLAQDSEFITMYQDMQLDPISWMVIIREV